MEPTLTRGEDLFARALKLPAGPGRDEFIATHCLDNPELRSEVESLLSAHENAGDFLRPNDAKDGTAPNHHWSLRAPSGGEVSPRAATSTGTLNAANYAEAFLGECKAGTPSEIDSFLASVPQPLRQETSERIAAAQRVQELLSTVTTATQTADQAMPRLAGFRIERKLGEGSLGVVYAGYDEKLDRHVAIKTLRQRGDEQVRRRVLNEARKAAALNNPAVVTIFSVLDESEPPAIVMEFVEGFALDRFAAQLNVQQKASLLREVARGLAAAHERGVIHRDLKPDNIIVGPDMRPRILDFGLALSIEEAGRQGRGFEGTPLYASPEQVLGKSLTAATDIFSFGSLMFKVLTGRAPFAGSTFAEVLKAIATTAPPFLREVAVGVPEDLQAICLACLAWKAADRPSASDLALELGRYLVGEPVRLKPKLYDDLLRRSISEYSAQTRAWESQSIISREERDSLEVVHRRLLADEDNWLIDARRITCFQTILSAATWLAVVATVLTVWMLRQELGPPWRWMAPAFFTTVLFGAGYAAHRQRDNLAVATFLAGATLAVAPCVLAILAELHLFNRAPQNVTQLFEDAFTNRQVMASAFIALAFSIFSLWRLRMTGFAWTTATLSAAAYVGFLLQFNWLDKQPDVQALWCLPLAAMEQVGLALERRGRVRWTAPFHLVALIALVAGLDVIAFNGPTLKMLGVDSGRFAYFDEKRLEAFSVVLNGLLFLILMLVIQRAASLDLRRASKLLEVLAIVHILSALFANATEHRQDPQVGVDVWLYLGAAVAFTVLAPFRSRWRMLVGGLLGCGLGSYLLVDLGLVQRKPFILGLGFAGLVVALATFGYVRQRASGR